MGELEVDAGKSMVEVDIEGITAESMVEADIVPLDNEFIFLYSNIENLKSLSGQIETLLKVENNLLPNRLG